MTSVKLLISIFSVYIFCLISHGKGQEFDEEETFEREVITNSDVGYEVVKCKKSKYKEKEYIQGSKIWLKRIPCHVIKCDKGACNESGCKCCPGYGVKETGIFSKRYSCEKCDCGKKYSCTFGWLGKKCTCPTGYSDMGGICTADCNANPCKNGGKCRVRDKSVVCKCTNLYTGKLCEYRNMCFPNPCQNGGTCVSSSDKATCQCSDGFIGFFCETEDPCFRNPCQNDGKCISSSGRATCQCSYRFSGVFCDKVIILEWWYSLVYYGALGITISMLIMPMALRIDYEDFFLLWYLMGRLLLHRLHERRRMHVISVIGIHNEVYNSICGLLKKILNLDTVNRSNIPDAYTDREIMYHCPICFRSQLDIFLDKDTFYSLRCGHMYCSRCIASMAGTTAVTCAICRETCQRESFLKIFLL